MALRSGPGRRPGLQKPHKPEATPANPPLCAWHASFAQVPRLCPFRLPATRSLRLPRGRAGHRSAVWPVSVRSLRGVGGRRSRKWGECLSGGGLTECLEAGLPRSVFAVSPLEMPWDRHYKRSGCRVGGIHLPPKSGAAILASSFSRITPGPASGKSLVRAVLAQWCRFRSFPKPNRNLSCLNMKVLPSISTLVLCVSGICYCAVGHAQTYPLYETDFNANSVVAGYAVAPSVADWYAYDQNGSVLNNLANGSATFVSDLKSLPTKDGYFFWNEGAKTNASKEFSYGTSSAGTGTVYFGLSADNYTGSVLSDFQISYSSSSELVLQYYITSSSTTSYSGSWGWSDLLTSTAAGATVVTYTDKDFSTPLSLGVGEKLWLRLVNSTSGAAYIDDVSVIASTAIPEPSTYALLLGVGTLGLVGWRRFRRK